MRDRTRPTSSWRGRASSSSKDEDLPMRRGTCWSRPPACLTASGTPARNACSCVGDSGPRAAHLEKFSVPRADGPALVYYLMRMAKSPTLRALPRREPFCANRRRRRVRHRAGAKFHARGAPVAANRATGHEGTGLIHRRGWPRRCWWSGQDSLYVALSRRGVGPAGPQRSSPVREDLPGGLPVGPELVDDPAQARALPRVVRGLRSRARRTPHGP